MRRAHIRPGTFVEQSVEEHLRNVSDLTKKYGSKISLPATGELLGYLHDMGKGTKCFDAYIYQSALNPKDKSMKGKINHSTAGAKYIYDNFFDEDKGDKLRKLTAQFISLAICSHHGGLIDCLDIQGIDKFSERMKSEKDIFYNEALDYFLEKCTNEKNIYDLFTQSALEIKSIIEKISQIDNSKNNTIAVTTKWFSYGMIEKYLFSCLIDADRYDTYTFMANVKEKAQVDSAALWSELSAALELGLGKYPCKNKIDQIRHDISKACKDSSDREPGIYQLSVPTGGGKTLSSLRFAINHAKEFKLDHIFYIIPYTSIIDQNAQEIKEILGRTDVVLEHHSNLVREDENEDDADSYKLLTECWDSPIVLTTMVQFLNTLFSGGTKDIRRMHNLVNSVIIFDEIQAMPIKCVHMFNSALNFLSHIGGSTVVLCTATQPLLSEVKIPIKLGNNPSLIGNTHDQFRQLKRVNIIDESILGGYDEVAVKDFVIKKMDSVKSLLVILNTKGMANKLFKELKRENSELPAEKQYIIFHLSTNMCPAHRIKKLRELKALLGNERVICISTQLIEAGVNISFECVVRSLAGMDSIAQAAGRCNRHGERPCSEVYIVNVNENVNRLVDIKEGQCCSERVLSEFKENPEEYENELLSEKIMKLYYRYYFYNRRSMMDYTLPKENQDKTMYDILSANSKGAMAFESRKGRKSNLILKQAFKIAGNEFQAIEQNTSGVIVPFEEGADLITRINGDCDLDELKGYLKKAQQFSVNLFELDIKRLDDKGGLLKLKEGVVYGVKREFYDDDVGIILEGKPMEFYDY